MKINLSRPFPTLRSLTSCLVMLGISTPWNQQPPQMGCHPHPHPKNLLLTVYYTPLAGCIYTSCLFILVSTTRTLIHSWILFLVVRSFFFFFFGRYFYSIVLIFHCLLYPTFTSLLCLCVSASVFQRSFCLRKFVLFCFFFLFPLIQPVNFRSFQFAYSSGSSQLAIWCSHNDIFREKPRCSVSPSLGSTLFLLFSPKLSHSLANSFVKHCKLLHLYDAFLFPLPVHFSGVFICSLD